MPKKLTTEQFKQRIFQLVGNEYQLIGEYYGWSKQVKIKHMSCTHEWPVFPNNFCKEDGTRCPKCNIAKQRKTQEEFIADIKRIWGNEITILGIYGRNNKEPVLVRHNSCGETYKTVPNYLLSGTNSCPNCKTNAKLSTEKFKERLFAIRGQEIVVIGKYYDMHTPILVRHNFYGCSHEWRPTPADLLHKGTSCPSCAGNLPLTHKEFLKRVSKIHGREYTILSKYINMKTNVKVKHKPCGKEYLVNPNCFINRRDGCKKCKGFEKSHEEFLKDVFNRVGQEYTVLGEYLNNKDKVKMRHENCGHEWAVRPNSFLSGSRCPRCNESKGNKAIFNYLTKNKIVFTSEFWFKDCRNIRPLRFDFAIFGSQREKEMNNKPLFLIEFQGRHHEEPVEAHGGIEGYLKCERNDMIKERYCKENNIDLFPIHYSNLEKIDEYLDEIMEKFSSVGKISTLAEDSGN